MLRTILGVIAGYVMFALALFVLFSGLYTVLGASGSFKIGNYDLTTAWLLSSVVVFFIAGVIAAAVCGLISNNPKSGFYMGATIIFFGLLIAIMQIAQDPGITLRDGAEVALMDAMNKAHGPNWAHFVNPIAGFIGAMIGGRASKGP